jgi:hypothetical protein
LGDIGQRNGAAEIWWLLKLVLPDMPLSPWHTHTPYKQKESEIRICYYRLFVQQIAEVLEHEVCWLKRSAYERSVCFWKSKWEWIPIKP